MGDELKKDIIDGKMIDWSILSVDELKKMRAEAKAEEQEYLSKINKLLEQDDAI
jgi:hypothetical protein